VVKYELVAVIIDPSYEEPLLTQPQPKKKSALVSYNHYKYLSFAFVAS
jgi:hypothetical protein